MTVTRSLRWWILGNLVWLLAVPLLFGIWLAADVDAQYASGARTNGSGDSVSLPVAGVALTNGLVLLVLNAAIALVFLFRRIGALRGAKQTLRRVQVSAVGQKQPFSNVPVGAVRMQEDLESRTQEGARVQIDLVRAVVEHMQATDDTWQEAFVRFQALDSVTAARASYVAESDVFIVDFMQARPFLKEIQTSGERLVELASADGNTACVFLLAVDCKLRYEFVYEWTDFDRWRISKLDGGTGRPEGFRWS